MTTRSGVALVLVLAVRLAAGGCSTFSAEKMEKLQRQLETGIGTVVGGDSKVAGTYYKNGVAYGSVTISWTCRKGTDGTLAGCTEPVVDFAPGAK